MKVINSSIQELHKLLVSKELSCTELTEEFLQHIDKNEQNIQAFLTLTEETALAKAAEIDKKIASKEEIGLLEGIPVALKDNICTEGIRTTCASRMLDNFVPPYDATVAQKLADAGTVLLGKLNMDEFGMGSTTESSAFHPTFNPWDYSRVPGGSSGGSAAAVAGREVAFALGTDTGGSIRQPAAFCGLVGLKPTYGTVSRYGVVAFASSLDQVGPITKTVRDNAIVLSSIAGHDPKDSTSASLIKEDYTQYLENNVKKLKIGIPKEFFGDGLSPDVHAVIDSALKTLEKLGAEIEECTMPHIEYAMPAYYTISPAEASSNLARFDGVNYGFRVEADDMVEMFKQTRAEGLGPEVKRRIMLGTYALSSGYYDAYYLKAQKVRTLVKKDFDQALAKYDVLISPTTPTIAYKAGEKSDLLSMYLGDAYTIPINLAGLPAITIPAGFVAGMPVGMQIIAKHFAEGLLYRVAYTYEQNTAYHREIPAFLKEGE